MKHFDKIIASLCGIALIIATVLYYTKSTPELPSSKLKPFLTGDANDMSKVADTRTGESVESMNRASGHLSNPTGDTNDVSKVADARTMTSVESMSRTSPHPSNPTSDTNNVLKDLKTKTMSSVDSMRRGADHPPNIVFILTDDQDVQLGGMEPMKKTKSLIGENGITFNNMFTPVPICCPSRASILTGNYIHNHGTLNNSVSGGCSSESWRRGPETLTFASSLKRRGYNTFFAGKYLNQCHDSMQKTIYIHNHGTLNNSVSGGCSSESWPRGPETLTFASSLKRRGYNTFFAGKYLNQYGKKRGGGVAHVPPGWHSWIGLVGNSQYYNYKLSVNGTREKHGASYHDDYLTDLIDKHWLVRVAHNPMWPDSVTVADDSFRNRWRTLLSVDDMVTSLISQLQQQNLLDNTYVFFSSDNGYHLDCSIYQLSILHDSNDGNAKEEVGQMSLPYDKRQMYEFDLRVPLMVRGPGIRSHQFSDAPVLTMDLAPTFLDIAGVSPIQPMDGQSLLPLLQSKSKLTNQRDFLIEYHGEYNDIIKGCPQYDHQFVGNCYPDCVCEDARNNTYSCVRSLGQGHNFKYCRFHDRENFVEAYNLNNDPDELSNIAPSLSTSQVAYFETLLHKLSTCRGKSCHR